MHYSFKFRFGNRVKNKDGVEGRIRGVYIDQGSFQYLVRVEISGEKMYEKYEFEDDLALCEE